MESEIFKKLLNEVPKENKVFIEKYSDLVIKINQILREKGKTQKELSRDLGKSPSEISKWLNGEHNFTLRSIAKLECELGEVLIEIPKKSKKIHFYAENKVESYPSSFNFESTKKPLGTISNWIESLKPYEKSLEYEY